MRLALAAAFALALSFPVVAQDECYTVEEATQIAAEHGWLVIGEVPAEDGSAFVFSGDAGTFASAIVDGCVEPTGTLIGPPIAKGPEVGA